MKLLIVLFAVCLVSIYATPFVKRDAPETINNIDELKQTLTAAMGKLNEQISQNFNEEQLKKSFIEGIDNFKKFLSDTQTKLQSTPTQ